MTYYGTGAVKNNFTYVSGYEFEGRDLVFVEVNFGVAMNAEIGDPENSAVGGLEIARRAVMEFGATIIAEGPLYSTNQKKAFLLSGPMGLATSLFEDHTATGSLEKALRDAYTAAAANSTTTANWGSTAVTVKDFIFA